MGVADHLTGDREPAVLRLQEGARRGAIAAPTIGALCLAQLALVAFERGNVNEAATAAGRARAVAERVGLHQATCALVLAVSALALARQGQVREAQRDLRGALHLLATFEHFAPWYEAETRIALARAALQLCDAGSAKSLLASASRSVSRADAVVLREWLEGGSADVDQFLTASVIVPQALTDAELRVLKLLPTHLSFREIGRHLYVSQNTIKTQVHAIYLKLDASSRSEAVRRARDLALLDVETVA